MIKMMDVDNGGTTLGNSNVYMTSSGNFKSNNLPILDCGKKCGIGDIGLPDFTNMAPEVAVIPGHGYVICDSDNVKEFPSRKTARRTVYSPGESRSGSLIAKRPSSRHVILSTSMTTPSGSISR